MSDKQQTGTGRRAEIAFPVRLDGKGFRPDTRNGGEFVPLLDAKGLWLADIRGFGDAHELIVSALNTHSDMKAALEKCQKTLAILIDPKASRNISGAGVVNAFALCTEAEAIARAALSGKGGAS